MEAAAVEAACAVAAGLGLRCDDPVRLAGGSNVLLHLRPAPVVARVMTATAVLHDDPRAWLERELGVLRFLGRRGVAVVPPSDLLDAGPHHHDGMWMTFTAFVPNDPELVVDPRDLGRSLASLHAALRDYDGDLPPRDVIWDEFERLLAAVPAPEAGGLRDELDRVRAAVPGDGREAQPLHGDAGLSNLLRTERGPVWNDFEDVCRGAVQWDVAGVVGDLRRHAHGREEVEAFLHGYGWSSGVGELAPYLAVEDLYGRMWRAFRLASARP